jgi:hypothetical protein
MDSSTKTSESHMRSPLRLTKHGLKDGKLVEYWDVAQEEVPATETKSGRPMFDSALSEKSQGESRGFQPAASLPVSSRLRLIIAFQRGLACRPKRVAKI